MRHIFNRQDDRNHTLVAVSSGHLVADLQLAPLGDRDADQLLHAGGQIVLVVAVEDADINDDAAHAVRDAQRSVFHFARLLAEDRAEQLFLRRQLGLALGRDLADQDVAGANLGADPDDALGIEMGQRFIGHVGDVAGDLFVAELGLARADLMLGHVDRRERVVLQEALGDDHRVLEVVALPGHERAEHVLAQCEPSLVGGRGVGQRLAGGHAVARGDDCALVDAGALVRAQEFEQRVVVQLLALNRHVVVDHNRLGGHVADLAVGLGREHLTRVAGGVLLHASADERRLGPDQRHGLALHVGAHQGAVGVVVLEERD